MVIFFDIDGTLLDHAYAERRGATAFLHAHRDRLSFTEDEFIGVWHTLAEKHFDRYQTNEISFQEQRRARVRELFGYADGAMPDHEADKIFAVYLLLYEQYWRPYPDVLPCLDSLAGFQLGIISNGDAEQQARKIEQMGLGGRFSPVVISGEVGIPKPAAEIFVEACRRAGRAPYECVYVGDRLDTDAQASRAAGLRGIWLNRDGLDRSADGITVIHSLAELANTI